MSFIILIIFILLLFVVLASTFQFESSPKTHVETVMDIDSFFRMYTEISHYTEFQLENVPFSGNIVQLEGRIHNISHSKNTCYDNKNNIYFEDELSVCVEVIKGNLKCLISWSVRWKKNNYYDPAMDYNRLSKGSLINFKGKVAKRQYGKSIYLEQVVVN
jgi:hypothetical protein